MFAGHATPEGTAAYAARFPEHAGAGFYSPAGDWTVSSLGIGTYLGGIDEQTDRNYTEAVLAALRGGINFIDTSLNYRHQSSERNIGAALAAALEAGHVRREEFAVCTKAGYLVPGAVPEGVLQASDIVGRMHSMAPAFLTDQLERSRANLRLENIDVFYLHNPETQLSYMDREQFYERVRVAFAALEEMVAQGKIGCYGTATWEGYRKKAGEGLSLTRLAALAEEVGGSKHHFRFIQLPFNLAMVEAFAQKAESSNGEPKSVLEAAGPLGITVVASATLLQSRLAANLPEEVVSRLPGASTDAQRAIQFTRSAPGISVALVGMSKASHVAENLGIARFPPATSEQFVALFQ